MNLLSGNDFSALSTALRHMEPLTLTKTLNGVKLTVSVRPAATVWPVAMVIQVKVKERGTEWVQTFESVEKAVEMLV